MIPRAFPFASHGIARRKRESMNSFRSLFGSRNPMVRNVLRLRSFTPNYIHPRLKLVPTKLDDADIQLLGR